MEARGADGTPDKGSKLDASRKHDNPAGLARDLSQLSSMPQLYDVYFTVGKAGTCIGGVKAILAMRSRVFFKMFYPNPDHAGRTASTNQSAQSKTQVIKHAFMLLKKEVSPKRDQKTDASTFHVGDLEPLAFSRLMEFLHGGSCDLDARTAVGLLAATDYFAIDDLQAAVLSFLETRITIELACYLLSEAEKYIQFKKIKALLSRLLEFTAKNACEILRLPAFCSLSRSVVRLILSRGDFNASEWDKFKAAQAWGVAYCRKNKETSLKEALEPLVECIAFNEVPAVLLMQNVRKLDVVPPHVIMEALAYQADPTSVASTPERGTNIRQTTDALDTREERSYKG
ncbi:predicted protein [Nematostella vectensis]|uniref:BTB domain-containing protein n=2 Tax=Nematostella vectensis TaxID=45351 RepID=A7RY38_NEMVE|nr:serine-enriched protein isoform X2 [Nematostella vectensis]EDO43629.1 predicted protein [Nematostella vectensis]|eukprot:XP_001635692.1 predicted protein [Nematostella vectensis]